MRPLRRAHAPLGVEGDRGTPRSASSGAVRSLCVERKRSGARHRADDSVGVHVRSNAMRSAAASTPKPFEIEARAGAILADNLEPRVGRRAPTERTRIADRRAPLKIEPT